MTPVRGLLLMLVLGGAVFGLVQMLGTGPDAPVEVEDAGTTPGEAGGLAGRAKGGDDAPAEPLGPYRVAGRVVDAKGAPIQGVPVEVVAMPSWAEPFAGIRPLLLAQRVRVTVPGDWKALVALPTTRTDASGRFVVTGVPDAHLLVRAHRSWDRRSTTVRVTASDPAALEVELTTVSAESRRVEVYATGARRPTEVLLSGDDPSWSYGPVAFPREGSLEISDAPHHPLTALVREGERLTLILPVSGDADGVRIPFPSPSGVTVSGVVTGPDDAPVADAGVELEMMSAGYRPPYAKAKMRTDQQGRFEVAGLPSAWVRSLVVRAEGFAVWRHRGSTGDHLKRGQRSHFPIRLASELMLTGRVVDTQGAALEGAEVTVGRSRDTRATTDASGAYRVRGLAAGTAHISCRLEGYRLLVQETGGRRRSGLLVQPGMAPLTLTMTRATTVHGIVVDTGGSPVAGCLVESEGRASAAPTDAEGRFRIEGLPAGSAIELVARAEGLRSEPVPHVRLAPGGEAGPITLTMRPALAITGRVLTEDDEPVEGRLIRLGRGGVFHGMHALSDRDGNFSIPDLLPGRYTAIMGLARHWGIDTQEFAVRLSYDAKPEPLLFRSASRVALVGRVTDGDGIPLAGLSVRVKGENAGGIHANPGGYYQTGDHGGQDQTDADGEFRIPGLWGGELDYVIDIQGMRVPGTFRAGGSVQTIVAPHTTAERVVCEVLDGTGAPIPLATIGFQFKKPSKERGWRPWEWLGSDSLTVRDGKVTVAWPKEAEAVDVTVEPRDASMGQAKLTDLRPVKGELRVQLPNAASGELMNLEVRVRDADGNPVPGAEVEIDHTEATDHPRFGGRSSGLFFTDRTAPTDADGIARFASVPAGPARVRARASRTHLRTDPIGVKDGEIAEIEVSPGGSVRGRVVDADGVGIAKATVVQAGIKRYNDPPQCVTDENGAFEIFGLPATGSVSLRVDPQATRSRPLRGRTLKGVDPAGTEPVEIQLDEGYWVRGQFLRPDGRSVRKGEVFLTALDGKRVGHEYLGDDFRGGWFEIGPLRAGTYRIHIEEGVSERLDVFMRKPHVIEVPGPDLELSVEADWDLTLKVVPPPHENERYTVRWCPDERIYSHGEDKGPSFGFRGRDMTGSVSTKDGTAYVWGVREESGYAYVYSNGTHRQYALIRVDQRPTEPLEVELEEGQSITGRVMSGSGRRSVRIRQGAIERTIATDKEGKFAFHGVPPGEWRVEHYKKSFRGPEQIRGFMTVAAGRTDIELP